MRTRIQVLVLAAIASFAKATGNPETCASINDQLNAANDLFKREGPTANALAAYEQLVTANSHVSTDKCLSNAVLAQIYYKRALIEIHLRREARAIAHLKQVLELDPASPARLKLVQLLRERGDFTLVKQYAKQVTEDIEEWESQWQSAQELYSDKEWEECYAELSHVLHTSPQFTDALNMRYLAAQQLIQKFGANYRVNDQSVSKIIVEDLEKLVQFSPLADLNRYVALAQYLMYTQENYKRALVIAKNCVEIDNSHRGCGAISKHLTRMSPIFEPLVEHALACSHFYDLEEAGSYPEPTSINWKKSLKILQEDPPLVSKAERRELPEQFTNLELIELRAKEFDPHGKTVDRFMLNLHRFVCEAHIRVSDTKEAKRACASVPSSFFPKAVPHIDNLIRKQKWNEAREALNKFPQAAHQLKLYKARAKKVRRHFEEQEQQQQQEQFFRQQHYHQHQHQQQQQQQQFPDVDFYKILGVSEDADEAEIKRAYRSLSLKYHPDVYRGTEYDAAAIEEKMQQLNLAKEVLTDKEQREIYDRQRRGEFDQGNHHGFGGGGMHGDHHVHFDFSQFFGGNAFHFQ